MGRPKRVQGEAEKILVTLPIDTIAGLDEWLEELRAQVGGGGATRQDLIRDILARAVEEHGRERRRKGTKK